MSDAETRNVTASAPKTTARLQATVAETLRIPERAGDRNTRRQHDREPEDELEQEQRLAHRADATVDDRCGGMLPERVRLRPT